MSDIKPVKLGTFQGSTYVAPETINIMAPRPAGVKPRGRNARKAADPQFAYRMSVERHAAVVEAAELIGCGGTAEFVRWVAYAAANEIIRLAREAKKDQVIHPVRPIMVARPTGLPSIAPTAELGPQQAARPVLDPYKT